MKINLKDIYIPTGNEQISIPTLCSRGAIEGINFISMKHRGLMEITGESRDNPLIKPFLTVNGNGCHEVLQWQRSAYWIPSFYVNYQGVEWKGEICVPTGERGFYYQLEAVNNSHEVKSIEMGLEGCWYRTLHTINESKAVRALPTVFESGWNDLIVFELLGETPLFALAPMTDIALDSVTWQQKENHGITYRLLKELSLKPGEGARICFYWGLGLEEVGAATGAKEMLRKGWEQVRRETTKWLQERIQTTGDSRLDEVMNLNLFFNFFFATGRSLDTEEDVLMTSRSPRYYVSAAYWDRDSLLWSFPSILVTDAGRARSMLDYVFTTQRKNIGIHSRYIDGTVLEPGFELDELCAPVLALDKYLRATDDWEYLNTAHVQESLKQIIQELEKHRHPKISLYDTFLQPTDDPIVYPYLTYNNVLVWKVYSILSSLYQGISQGKAQSFQGLAEQVKAAIYEYMVVDYRGKKIFSWSVDLEGNFNVYDEPPGSLQLLSYYGFCPADDPVYINTVATIRSPENHYSFLGCEFEELGCAHANYPWVLSIGNSFLAGRKEQARDLVLRAPMDGGIACESIDPHTGVSRTGEHFATCAGFLAYGIYHAYGKKGE
ncbi:glycoside hydrolase family 125 protein [Alkaliphilus crotonatoxidans]